MLTKRKLENVYDLDFPKNDLDRLQKYVEYIKTLGHEFYLFGSYAKSMIKDSSDIDLMVIMDVETKKEARRIKLDLMDKIEDNVYEYYGEDFDLLAYPRNVFLEALNSNKHFETEINSYMLRI